jgi:AcrR family transcriptional regulator
VGAVTDPGRRVPRTGRGERTRDELLAAATDVFWDKGYLDSRVADIVGRAGVSHGTFYTYFDSKEAVLWAIAADLNEALGRTARGVRAETGGDEVAAIELANRRYLEMYLGNRKVMRLMEEVASFNPDMREARHSTRVHFVSRTTRSIERMQAAGIADAHLLRSGHPRTGPRGRRGFPHRRRRRHGAAPRYRRRPRLCDRRLQRRDDDAAPCPRGDGGVCRLRAQHRRTAGAR